MPVSLSAREVAESTQQNVSHGIVRNWVCVWTELLPGLPEAWASARANQHKMQGTSPVRVTAQGLQALFGPVQQLL